MALVHILPDMAFWTMACENTSAYGRRVLIFKGKEDFRAPGRERGSVVSPAPRKEPLNSLTIIGLWK